MKVVLADAEAMPTDAMVVLVTTAVVSVIAIIVLVTSTMEQFTLENHNLHNNG